jgi:hypothetical protein
MNFEPIASIDGQEEFFWKTRTSLPKDGAELLAPGVLYSAEERRKSKPR